MFRKSGMFWFAAAAALALGFRGEGALAQMSHEGHEMHGGAMTGGYGAPAAPVAKPAGAAVRDAKVQGYALAYRIYSWDERNVMMKGMEGMRMAGMDDSGKATNHLMVFVKGPDGKEVADGKVGFVVIGPDKTEQKTLTMAMGGGYGADVILKAKGAYTVKTKVVAGSATLLDEFSYTVK
jgi:hypothetical protein